MSRKAERRRTLAVSAGAPGAAAAVTIWLLPGIAVLPPFAAAQTSAEGETTKQVEVTPFIGYQWGGALAVEGGAAEIPSGMSYGVILSRRVRADAKMEFFYSREETSLEFQADTSSQSTKLSDLAVQYFQIGGLVELEQGRARPFVSGTLGLTWFDPSGDRESEVQFSGGLGLGLHAAISEKLALRLEGRGWLNLFNGSGSIFCGDGGCVVQGSASTMTQGEVLGGLSVGL